jgi:hypothetical protein
MKIVALRAATQYGSFKLNAQIEIPQPGNLSDLKWLCNREIYVNPDPDPDPCFVITTKVEFIKFLVLFFKF